MDGYGWIWMDMDGYGWIWMDMDGYGWIWMDMDGYGWIWMDMDGYDPVNKHSPSRAWIPRFALGSIGPDCKH